MIKQLQVKLKSKWSTSENICGCHTLSPRFIQRGFRCEYFQYHQVFHVEQEVRETERVVWRRVPAELSTHDAMKAA